MVLRISVWDSKELQAVILLMKGMDKAIATQVRRQIKSVVLPIWQEAVNANVTDQFEGAVLGKTARVAVSDQNVTLMSATIGRTLAGGLKPPDLMHDAEFGADRSITASYTATSRKGRSYKVTNRHTRNQFRPRNRKGYVVYPALAAVIPRILALWIQTAVREFATRLNGDTNG